MSSPNGFWSCCFITSIGTLAETISSLTFCFYSWPSIFHVPFGCLFPQMCIRLCHTSKTIANVWNIVFSPQLLRWYPLNKHPRQHCLAHWLLAPLISVPGGLFVLPCFSPSPLCSLALEINLCRLHLQDPCSLFSLLAPSIKGHRKMKSRHVPSGVPSR